MDKDGIFSLYFAHEEGKIIRSRLGHSLHSNGLFYKEVVVPFIFFFIIVVVVVVFVTIGSNE